MISNDVIYGAQIAVLLGFATTAVVLVLTSVLGIDVGRELRRLTHLLATERGLVPSGLAIDPGSRSASEEHQVLQESEANFHILNAGFSALFMSLAVTVLIIVLNEHLTLAWRIADLVTVLIHLNGAGRLAHGTITAREHTSQRWSIIVVGFTIAIIGCITAFGFFPAASMPIVFIGILSTLMVTGVSFFALLFKMLNSD